MRLALSKQLGRQQQQMGDTRGIQEVVMVKEKETQTQQSHNPAGSPKNTEEKRTREREQIEVVVRQPASLSAGLGATTAVSPQREVKKMLRNILGQVPSDPQQLITLLSRTFPIKQVDGRDVVEFSARPSLTATGQAGGGLTTAQASLYERARVAYEDAKQRLQVLRPQQGPFADPENVEAVRAVILTEYGKLVEELGRDDGPRVQRADKLFDALQNLFVQLVTVFGLNPEGINNETESQNFISYQIVQDNFDVLSQSWERLKGSQSADFGAQSNKLLRQFSLVEDALNDAEAVLDEVGFDATTRENFTIGIDDLTLDGLFSWIRDFVTEEAPAVVEDGGKIGVAVLIPTLMELRDLLQKVNEIITKDPRLEDENVKSILKILRGHLVETLKLAKAIVPDVG